MSNPDEMSASRSDFELPKIMASLELWDSSQAENINTEQKEDTPGTPFKRSLRKRIQTPKSTATVTNRRVILKPKRIQPNIMSEEDIKKLYSNAKVKTVSQRLETIFEEPKAVNDTILLIGGKKIKRSLKFPENSLHTKEKIKKRRSKIKRFLGNKNFTNRKKVSMQSFLKTLQSLDTEDPLEDSADNN